MPPKPRPPKRRVFERQASKLGPDSSSSLPALSQLHASSTAPAPQVSDLLISPPSDVDSILQESHDRSVPLDSNKNEHLGNNHSKSVEPLTPENTQNSTTSKDILSHTASQPIQHHSVAEGARQQANYEAVQTLTTGSTQQQPTDPRNKLAESEHRESAQSASSKPARPQTTAPTKKPTKGKLRKSAQSKTSEDSQLPVDDPGKGGTGSTKSKRRKRTRAPTPEDAEERTIDPSSTIIGDLKRDPRIGKKSERERQLREINWAEVKRRRFAAEDARISEGRASMQDNANQRPAPTTAGNAQAQGPQMRIVNGQIVVDQDSLVHDRHVEAMQHEGALETIEEDDLTNIVNTKSWIFNNKRNPGERVSWGRHTGGKWTAEQTEAFYEALRIWKTDFELISKMFPGRTRRQIKHKFTREERENPARIKEVLHDTTTMTQEAFQAYLEASGREEASFLNPEQFYAELREEEERHRLEIEKAKRERAEAVRKKQLAENRMGDSAKENEGDDQARKKKKKKGQPIGGDDVEVIADINDNSLPEWLR